MMKCAHFLRRFRLPIPARAGVPCLTRDLDPIEVLGASRRSSRFFAVLAGAGVLGISLACASDDGSLAGAATEATAMAASEAGEEKKGDPARDAWVVPDAMGEIYAANCAVCHGKEFEGSALGPALVGAPLAQGDGLDPIITSIAKGFGEKMPGWEKALPASDIRGLAVFLLEKREGDRGEKGLGIGAPPVIPTGTLHSKLHDFKIRTIRGGFDEPYSIAPLPDGRILVTEKMGGLSIVSADGSSSTRVTGTPKIYTDSVLRGSTYAGMGWMHEVALHPDYAKNGWIYLTYGDRCEQCNTASRETGRPVVMIKLVRGKLAGNAWVDQQTIWEADKELYQDGLENGAGARITFDDAGHVYFVVGHFVDYRGVQDLDFPYGKIMRVHDDGRIPADNPFVKVPGAIPAIYTVGHRVVQGLDFDRATGRVWATEHGPRGGDELNWIRAGINYGWPVVSEGVDYDGRPIHYGEELGIEVDRATLERPRVHWTPSPGASSLVFYRGPAFPKWQDHALVATLSKNELWRYVLDENGEVEHETLIAGLGRIRDVEVGTKGELLLLLEHRTGSQILRVEPVR
ncbi:MAG: PQQ-dependent sugar dehydrogenase [Deltaproteobacteria bacterium]|nr:PQQ-dependent sugar dehydrogenase [Deltaproteobacteria bacterium]